MASTISRNLLSISFRASYCVLVYRPMSTKTKTDNRSYVYEFNKPTKQLKISKISSNRIFLKMEGYIRNF